jgi:hypothetical protein
VVVTANAKEKETKPATADTGNTATTVLTGSVTDIHSGESLVGVEVKIEGTDLKTYTDFDGKFTFSNVKPGEKKLVASYISYQASAETVTANSKENKLNIQLKPSL